MPRDMGELLLGSANVRQMYLCEPDRSAEHESNSLLAEVSRRSQCLGKKFFFVSNCSDKSPCQCSFCFDFMVLPVVQVSAPKRMQPKKVEADRENSLSI